MKRTNYLQIAMFICGIVLLFSACTNSDTTQSPGELPTTSNYPEIEKFNQRIATDAENPELYYARAKKYLELKGYDEAIADLSKAIRLDSSKVDYHHLLADTYLEYSKSYQAISTLKALVEKHPKRIPSMLKLSQFQLIIRKYDEALMMISQVIQLDPQNAEAFFLKGLIYREQGERTGAINSLQRAVEQDSDLIDAWIMLGELFAEDKNPIALKYFDNAVRVAPDNVAALHTKANYLQQSGALPDAIQLYRKIIRIAPDYTDAFYNTGLAYLEMDSVDLAYKNFDIVVKTEPTNVGGYYFRGIAAQMKGQISQAKNDYQQALNLSPDFEEAKKALDELTAQ